MMSRNIPEGMEQVTAPEVERDDLTVMRPEQFTGGGMAVFRGTRMVGQGDKAFEVMLLSSAKKGDDAPVVGLRWTQQLSLLLTGIRPGERFYLRYEGREPSPRNAEMFTHRWTVAREKGRAEAVQQAAQALPAAQFE